MNNVFNTVNNIIVSFKFIIYRKLKINYLQINFLSIAKAAVCAVKLKEVQ